MALEYNDKVVLVIAGIAVVVLVLLSVLSVRSSSLPNSVIYFCPSLGLVKGVDTGNHSIIGNVSFYPLANDSAMRFWLNMPVNDTNLSYCLPFLSINSSLSVNASNSSLLDCGSYFVRGEYCGIFAIGKFSYGVLGCNVSDTFIFPLSNATAGGLPLMQWTMINGTVYVDRACRDILDYKG